MKKMMLSVKLNAPDDFNVGDCTKCPISIKKNKEVSYNNWVNTYTCPLGCSKVTCPIEPMSSN